MIRIISYDPGGKTMASEMVNEGSAMERRSDTGMTASSKCSGAGVGLGTWLERRGRIVGAIGRDGKTAAEEYERLGILGTEELELMLRVEREDVRGWDVLAGTVMVRDNVDIGRTEEP